MSNRERIEIQRTQGKIERRLLNEGKPVGKDHWKGTYTYTSGTVKFKGIKGSGTWESFSMGQGYPFVLEIVGEQEIPKQ